MVKEYLDSTAGNHLLSEIVLVLANAAFPSGASLVFAHHDFLGDLVE